MSCISHIGRHHNKRTIISEFINMWAFSYFHPGFASISGKISISDSRVGIEIGAYISIGDDKPRRASEGVERGYFLLSGSSMEVK